MVNINDPRRADARGWGSGWPHCSVHPVTLNVGGTSFPGGVAPEVHDLMELLLTESEKRKLVQLHSGWCWGYGCRPITGTTNVPSNHCLTGETLVQTPDGPVPIAELAGTEARLLTRNPMSDYQRGKWVMAPVRSFGEDDVYAVRMSLMGQERTVRATASHRWFVHRGPRGEQQMVEVTSSELRRGDRLATVLPPALSRLAPSPYGIAAGLVFGDGSRFPSPGGAFTRLWGKDRDLLRYFPVDCPTSAVTTDGGVGGIEVRGLPRLFKEAPSLQESSSYLAGWLAGYLAADGHVRVLEVRLSSSTHENLELASAVAARLGIATRAPVYQKRAGGFAHDGAEGSWQLAFISATVPDWLLLHRSHLEAFHSVPAKPGRVPCWQVADVEPDGHEEVFCATVPGTGAFALDGWLLTGNSWGLAIDINAPVNGYGSSSHTIPAAMGGLWNRYGFRWGGQYSGTKDWMHFEFMGTPADARSMTDKARKDFGKEDKLTDAEKRQLDQAFAFVQEIEKQLGPGKKDAPAGAAGERVARAVKTVEKS